MANFYPFTAISGGGTGAMDALAVAGLSTGDVARIVTSTGTYDYVYNSATTDSDDGLFRIIPDDNVSGTGCWHLVGTTVRIGALLKLTSTQALSSGNTIIPWDAAEYDVGGWWSAGSPTRLTVPVGVTKIQAFYSGYFDTTIDSWTLYEIKKNGAGGFVGGHEERFYGRGSNDYGGRGCIIHPVPVSAADYFEAFVYISNAETLSSDRVNFSIEAIGFE